MTTKFFYAEENRYGLGTTTTIRRSGREIIVSAGRLFRFTTAAKRDQWVSENARNREPLTAAQARKYHATGNLSEAFWEDDNAISGSPVEAGFDRFIERKF